MSSFDFFREGHPQTTPHFLNLVWQHCWICHYKASYLGDYSRSLLLMFLSFCVSVYVHPSRL